jgi:lipopolysaccharide/colanic/teichoic acid biosynthesis glycosyltransferase
VQKLFYYAALYDIIWIAPLVIKLLGTVFLFSKPSNTWFRQMKKGRNNEKDELAQERTEQAVVGPITNPNFFT